MNLDKIYIGWDKREKLAADVCWYSIRAKNDKIDLAELRLPELINAGFYWRASETQDGQRIDSTSGTPFSTDFAFSRFLVPYLNGYKGWALFCDCDFLWLRDPATIMLFADPTKAVSVVQHVHEPREDFKMDHQKQVPYPRKNWSSLMLFNCEHEDCAKLTPHAVSEQPPAWLHRFQWTDDVGQIAEDFNWLAGISPTTEPAREFLAVEENAETHRPAAIHYTLGGPWFDAYRECEFAQEWIAAERSMFKEGEGLTASQQASN